MSPSAASGNSETVTASWKALTIQVALSGATANSRAIVGSATLTMLPSSTAMVIAMARVENAKRRCGLSRPSWTWAASGAEIGSGRFNGHPCADGFCGLRGRIDKVWDAVDGSLSPAQAASRTLHQLHLRPMSRGGGETPVAGDERGGESLGERHIDGVIGGKNVAQLP